MISIRGTLFTAAVPATTIARTRLRPPKLELLPVTMPPAGALLLSALVHTAVVFALVTWLAVLFPGWPVNATDAKARSLREPDHEVLWLPILPQIEDTGFRRVVEGGSKKRAPSLAKPEAKASQPASVRPKPHFAGPQEIVSDLPDSTNSVQTIRRPDLVAPPKLTNPVRLQSLVMLPAHAPQVPVAPRVDQPMQPVLPNPQELAPFRVSEPRVQMPVLPMGVPIRSSVVPAEPVVPKIADTSHHGLPVFSPTTPSAPKAVVVINAVSVPPESSPVIPDAELSGNFVVGPSIGVSAGDTGSAVAVGSVAGAGASIDGGNSSHAIAGNASGAGVGTNGSRIGAARTGSISIMGGRPGPGGGAGTGAGAGNGSMPGISISGSIPGRSGVAAMTSAISHGSYAITVISGGSSGGASRDLGVFSREDTVYTVYIPMTDAGGGPDWPIEYALISSAPAGNGLLTPPFAVKKMQATGPETDLAANSGPVFVTGIIDEKGKLQALRAVHASDVQSAVCC